MILHDMDSRIGGTQCLSRYLLAEMGRYGLQQCHNFVQHIAVTARNG